MRVRLIVLVSLVFAGGGIFIVRSSASADPFNACGSIGGCEPDNKTHSGCFRSGGSISSMRSEIQEFFWNTLDLRTSLVTTWDNTCSSITDVKFDDDLMNPGFLGFYQCQGFTSGECEKADITMNAGLLTTVPLYRATLCHELGHSLGLSHTTDDCMASGFQNGWVAPWDWYSPHHATHIENDIN